MVYLRHICLDQKLISFQEAILKFQKNCTTRTWEVVIENGKHFFFEEPNNHFCFILEAVDINGRVYRGPCVIEFVAQMLNTVHLQGIRPLQVLS
ncbi:hypothetical protein CHL76_11775 [Marinococcus halophilus]|uniref:Uncharacterized protein n=1 Tax=Marinococcus halophilus TaxID=1371 RepID=A0A510Y7X1_MARHA|nr:hypothetical protein [Marinococcus halophilus]OZT79589.1 hypothetical protein CHL76_11775 [Marinococcus halophilus]GEK59478.1 hypothetical protein MHA01_23830 [Marinococcus halophilus]